MREPLSPASAVNLKRVKNWLATFEGFRHPITEPRIDRWLEQFQEEDRDLAARVLDVVEFIPTAKVAATYRAALAALPGWHADEGKRLGKFRFVAFSSSAGESGDVMLARLRHANALSARRFNKLFLHRSELPSSGLSHGDTVVFVDDFSGTGEQVCTAWPDFAELLPEGVEAVLLLVAATESALGRMRSETELNVVTEIILTAEDGVFNAECKKFSVDEKSVLQDYCDACVGKSSRRFSEAGFVVVFAHTCPNNSLPILHSRSPEWEGLFCRYD